MEDIFIEVGNYPNYVQANIGKSKLELNGIEGFIFDGGSGSMLEVFSMAIGGAKLKVKKGDEERALQILNKDNDDENIEQTEELEFSEDKFCHNCHSKNLTMEKIEESDFRNILIMLGLKIFLSDNRYYCNDCKHKWNI